MKVKVVKTFRDIHTGEIYKAGAEVEFTKERIDEILSKGKFIKVPEEKKEAKKQTKKDKA